MGGSGGGKSAPPPPPTPIPTKDQARVTEDKETATLRKRGRRTTNTGASGEPMAAQYAPTSVLVSSGSKKTTGA